MKKWLAMLGFTALAAIFSVFPWEKACAEEPSKNLPQTLFKALSSALPQASPPSPSASVQAPADSVPSASIAAVQAFLLQERLYSGPVDGNPSRATTAAIRRFQILHRMQATGALDDPTLRAMLTPSLPGRELRDADRALLKELSEMPAPVAEAADAPRIPIPPGPPIAVASPVSTPKKGKAGRTRHSHPVRQYEARPQDQIAAPAPSNTPKPRHRFWGRWGF